MNPYCCDHLDDATVERELAEMVTQVPGDLRRDRRPAADADRGGHALAPPQAPERGRAAGGRNAQDECRDPSADRRALPAAGRAGPRDGNPRAGGAETGRAASWRYECRTGRGAGVPATGRTASWRGEHRTSRAPDHAATGRTASSGRCEAGEGDAAVAAALQPHDDDRAGDAREAGSRAGTARPRNHARRPGRGGGPRAGRADHSVGEAQVRGHRAPAPQQGSEGPPHSRRRPARRARARWRPVHVP